jgi:glycine cleavage system H protein
MARERATNVPEDRHYDAANHLWASRDERTGRVRIGIDAIGLESLGELAYVALHAVGLRVARGEAVGSLEAAKTTTTIRSPLSGTIRARNAAVLQDPLAVNEDPYGRGWLFELEPVRWRQEASQLVSGAAIGPWAAAEVAKLRAGEQAG